MGRSVKHILVGPENLLRAIAMMDIEIDDGDALGAMFCAGVMSRNRDVVEQTEAHGCVAFGMVTGRTHLTEHV
jgi:hypothetical protein